MKLAFFDMRAEKLIAKIHADNAALAQAFEHSFCSKPSPLPCTPGHDVCVTCAAARKPAGVTHIQHHAKDKARLETCQFEEVAGIFELGTVERATAGGGE